jgi:hypothetical protein
LLYWYTLPYYYWYTLPYYYWYTLPYYYWYTLPYYYWYTLPYYYWYTLPYQKLDTECITERGHQWLVLANRATFTCITSTLGAPLSLPVKLRCAFDSSRTSFSLVVSLFWQTVLLHYLGGSSSLVVN